MSSDLKPAALARNQPPRVRSAVGGGQAQWLRWTLMDRYVLRELVGPFLFGIAAFTSIFVAGQFLFKLTSFIAQGAPVLEVLALFALKLVPMIILTFPMASLLATLLAYGRLSGDSEITAMAASGIPFMRIAVPAFWLGLAASFAGLVVNEVVVPHAGRASAVLEAAITKAFQEKGIDAGFVSPGKAVVIQDYEDGRVSRVVIAMGFNLRDKTLQDVTLIQYDQRGKPSLILNASSAVWEKDRGWSFLDARWQRIKSAAAFGDPGAADTRLPSSGSSQKLAFTFNKTPDEVLASQKKPEEMSFGELRGYLAALKDQSVDAQKLRDLHVDLYNKVSIPFASLVFTLIGTPLALRRLRGGASVGSGLSVLIIFGYYIVWHGMTIMAQGGHLPPLLASWTANLLGLVVGGVLVARAAS